MCASPVPRALLATHANECLDLSQGAAEVAPYFCLNDFILSRAEGTGLSRAHTLAQGHDRCDFRYKKGREVTQDWDTETPKFARNTP